MATSVKTKMLKIHMMPESVHNHYTENNLINENELYLVSDDLVSTLSARSIIIAENPDYAEIGEWTDGNPNDEDRIGYFVALDPSNPNTIIKATTNSDIRGITIENPGFVSNVTDDKFDSNGNLLPQYDFVAFNGYATVIDNGTCEINSKCMPAEDGTAIPSTNDCGYQVISRVDDSHVTILVEPHCDAVQRLKCEFDRYLKLSGGTIDGNLKVTGKLYLGDDELNWVTNEDIDLMLARKFIV